MLSRLKERLRKLKRRRSAIDPSIRLAHPLPLEGYTDEGSPYFSLQTPVTFRCPINPQRPILGVTLFRDTRQPPGRDSRFNAEIAIDTDGATHRLPLRCVDVWDTVAIDLSESRSVGGRADLTLRVDGPHREALSLGGLRLHPAHGAPIKREVQGVSYPRSGHHLLVNVLKAYFGPEFNYCSDTELNCNSLPCRNSQGANLRKNHDHELTFSTSLPDTDYLIQFRRPLYSIVSNFYLAVRSNPVSVKDSQEGWQSFAAHEVERWNRWMRKWVLDNPNPRRLTVIYESVMENPLEELLRIVRFFSTEHTPDRARLAQIIRRLDVRPRRKLTQFPYYEPGFFGDLEQQLADVAEAAGLPRLSPN
jgi:hypothetical protein